MAKDIEKLKGILIDLNYEIDMFKALTYYLLNQDFEIHRIKKNALLDSWIVHFRNLYYFHQ